MPGIIESSSLQRSGAPGHLCKVECSACGKECAKQDQCDAGKCHGYERHDWQVEEVPQRAAKQRPYEGNAVGE